MNLQRNNQYPPEGLSALGLEAISGETRQAAGAPQVNFLIVTNFPNQFAEVLAQSVVVRTCKDAQHELQKKSFKAIFCDLGTLGPDENGLKFAFSLKLKGTQTPLFLMSDKVTLEDESHAMHQGAKGLINRSADSLQNALRQQSRLAAGPFRVVDQDFSPTSEQKPLIPLEALDRVKCHLRKHIGPVADDLVFKTLVTIGKRYPKGVPYHALVHAVANYIEVAKERDRFLTELGV